MDNSLFYNQLKSIKSFFELSNNRIYTIVPEDWYLLKCKVKNSTNNIDNYKDVNMAVVMCIVGIVNQNKNIQIPYIFSGDKALILVPKKIYESAKQVLLASKKVSKRDFGLELKVSSICVEKLEEIDRNIVIAKYELSGNFYQALLRGEGIDYFDSLTKQTDRYNIKDTLNPSFNLDLEGLDYSWDDMESSKEKTVTLVFKAVNNTDYKVILDTIENIISSKENRHPVSEEKLKRSFTSSNLVSSLFMRLNINKWKNFKSTAISSCEIQKFDNRVLMVFSTTDTKVSKLEDYLYEQYRNKKLVYGLKKSNYVLMTCFLPKEGRSISFIDIAKGGFALAKKDYKHRLKGLESLSDEN